MKKYLPFLILIIFGCNSTDITTIQTAEELYKDATVQYKENDYLEAIEIYKELLLRFPASTIADEAQFYLAESRYKRNEFMLAALEYDYLIKTMPSSNFVDYARYKKAIAYYQLSPKYPLDQKYTVLALDELQNFIENTSNEKLKKDSEKRILIINHKLAQKIYESSLIYYHLHYYRSAITYCELLKEKYPDSNYIDDVLLIKAKSYFERENSRPKTIKKDFTNTLRAIEELKERPLSNEIKLETDFILASINEMQKSS